MGENKTIPEVIYISEHSAQNLLPSNGVSVGLSPLYKDDVPYILKSKYDALFNMFTKASEQLSNLESEKFIATYNQVKYDELQKELEELKSKDEWISVKDRLPEFIEGHLYSENVFVKEDNHTETQVMCLSEIMDDGGNLVDVWCNCYGDINGDGTFDDNYIVTHWKPINK